MLPLTGFEPGNCHDLKNPQKYFRKYFFINEPRICKKKLLSSPGFEPSTFGLEIKITFKVLSLPLLYRKKPK